LGAKNTHSVRGFRPSANVLSQMQDTVEVGSVLSSTVQRRVLQDSKES